MIGGWISLGSTSSNGGVRHHVAHSEARQTTCNRWTAEAHDFSSDYGSDPCRRCWAKTSGTKPPQDRRGDEVEESMPTKTKKPPKTKDTSKSVTGEKLPDTREQIAGKLKAIQTQNTTVENLKLAWDGAKDDAKQAKKSYETARIALHVMIHDIPQGTLFDQVSREIGTTES